MMYTGLRLYNENYVYQCKRNKWSWTGTLLILDINLEELNLDYMQTERCSILSDVVKYVKSNQHTIGYYRLEVTS